MDKLASSFYIFKEGGQSVEWFTELEIIDNSRHGSGINDHHVKIISHYQLHYDEYENWPVINKEAPIHPRYYGSEIWRESGEGRIATHYNLPFTVDNIDNKDCKWCEIVNPRYIFSYE